MKNITINYTESTIEMTAIFAKKAQIFGSEEYKQLVEVKREFPDYKIVKVTSSRKNTNHFKGLTYAYMEKFIREKNDTEMLEVFAQLRGMELSEGALIAVKDEMVREVASFFEVKAWFLETYHETFEDYDKSVKDILAKSKAARAQRKAG